MKWFKHDTDASLDAKLQTLLFDYGAKGYGLYWYLIELIAGRISAENITFELEHDARVIAQNLQLTIAECEDMMRKMIELRLFEVSQNNRIACRTLSKRVSANMTADPKLRALITHEKQCDQNRDKEKKRKEKNNITHYAKEFDSFWSKYPRKKDKAKAKVAFIKAINKVPIDTILNAINNQINSKQWQDKQFIPYPTTWLNGERWEDDVDQVNNLINNGLVSNDFLY